MSTGKTVLATTFVAVFLWAGNSLFAEDLAPAHTYKDGEIISSDLLNESFYAANNSSRLTNDEVVGTWSCDIWTKYQKWTEASVALYTLSPSGLYYEVANAYTVTFSDDGDGSYSFSSKAFPSTTVNETSTSYDFSIIENTLIYKHSDYVQASVNYREASKLPLNIISKTRFSIDNSSSVCTKQNLPPANPTSLTASVTGSDVTLGWTDNSADEDGFKVTRKDSLTGAWTDLVTESANSTSSIDSVTTAGSYWYRVKSTNGNGDSLGSNVVQATVTD